MNYDALSTAELEALEAQTAAQESTWLALAAQVANGKTPRWTDAAESIDTSVSIHGKQE